MRCNARVKYSHNLYNSVQIILFPEKIYIMQYFYLLNVGFSIFQACLLHWGHHMHVRVVKILKINLGNICLLDFKSKGLRHQKQLGCFMDGNFNIITEILLVISYTTIYCKK